MSVVHRISKISKLTLRFLRSISKRLFRPGLCTLITTSWPFSFARWTWPAKETTNLSIPFNQPANSYGIIFDTITAYRSIPSNEPHDATS